jgi:serine/threonine protein kinase
MNSQRLELEAGLPISTGSNAPSLEHNDPRVIAALEEYLAALELGHPPLREDFLAQHAEIAAALGEYLDGLRLVHAASLNLASALPEASGLATPVLGDFRIVREVGRGGMGIVYEAVQISLGRRVALKILSGMASNDSRQRFRVEAQAAAQLHHPHIVPIFAVGSDRGVDYYAMQFIEGRTLAAVIEDLRNQEKVSRAERELPSAPADSEKAATASNAESNPSSWLSSSTSAHRRAFFESIARLGVQAADALDHAHHLGVLHRDIKPSNLMVDGDGDLWITDFGLARFRDDSSLTESGDVIGTLRYMSPEQALGRRELVDRRVDVYALGATLYELATLRPVFAEHDRHALLSKITFDEPIAARNFNPSIPRDLETIILKALTKDVGARYADAREMSEDLRRFLENRPIHARRPTVLDRAAKWSRRHQTALAAMSIAVVATLAISSVLLWRAQQRTLAALAGLHAAHQRERATLKSFFRVADGIMMQAMASLSRTSSQKGAAPNGFYRSALAAYEQTAEGYRNNSAMRLIAAEALRRVGFVRMILRYYEKEPEFARADAEGPYHEAIRLCEAEIAAFPGREEPLRKKSEVMVELAMMLSKIGDVERAEPLLREALTTRADWLPLPYTRDDVRHQWCDNLVHRSRALSAGGRDQDGARLLDEALAIEPGHLEALNGLAWHLSNDPRRVDYAPERALALADRAVAAAPDNAGLWNTLAMARFRAGQWGLAKTAIEKAMQLHEPDASDWLILAMIDHRQGYPDEARRAFQRARSAMASEKTTDPGLRAVAVEAARLLDVK